MKWVKDRKKLGGTARVPIKSWCQEIEDGALQQAADLAHHPVVESHVALMPDCHVGYGMPIGGVIGCKDAVIPNAVGVDIGCGMGAVRTNLPTEELKGMDHIRNLMNQIKKHVPLGEGKCHSKPQHWDGFKEHTRLIGSMRPGWMTDKGCLLDRRNLGTLGGGNHFIELQSDEDGYVWMMLHSGSRNLGYRVASYYHHAAQDLNAKYHANIPNKHLAFLPLDSPKGEEYIRDMNFALRYARENRRRMMEHFKHVLISFFGDVQFLQEINIHHNYAAAEDHFGKTLWVHRKGATSAKKDELGIIPGSMGTSSYIVKGIGNPASFTSCSHGAGRKMGRKQACRRLSVNDCNRAMEGVVFDRWKRTTGFGGKRQKAEKLTDLSEAPLAYKSIDEVIEAELDLIKPIYKLHPLGVLKG